MSNRAFLRKLKRLEKAFNVEPCEDWVDIVMWGPHDGGLFGHVHYFLERNTGKGRREPCSEEEEIAIMREHYENSHHKLPGQNEPVSFVEFLEYFSYLGCEELEARKKEIIEQLKGEKDGARVEDTSRRAC